MERRLTNRDLYDQESDKVYRILNPRSMSTSELMDIGQLRKRTWQAAGQTIRDFDGHFSKFWLEEEDYNSYHVTIYEDGKLIGAARLGVFSKESCLFDEKCLVENKKKLTAEERFGYLACLVVAPEYQGQGLGTKLLTLREQLAMRICCDYLMVVVSEAGLPKLQRLGFTVQYPVPGGTDANPSKVDWYVCDKKLA